MRAAGPILALLVALTVLGVPAGTGARAIEEALDEYPDYEYQRTTSKRAALLLDRLLVALQKAVENNELEKGGSKPFVRSLPEISEMPDSPRMHLSDEKIMDLQRRGQAKGRIYWRCYFNAVTCFKRK
ncbi:PREDICTED: uncharacterized protein LOC105364591 [Ceratosolen solmsi marchali]|uniref:Uncharacterized protein LOC105364591 n=1 Tax=Ceratosolen solmsi marchali TaxID=326594 RepID=A0AAJ6YML1_9HYME|nr:PREDICTED: uncharacterized protein LOC105364591 [Ceratosolen solmsi marchali]